MNEHIPNMHPDLPGTFQVAEGMPRRAWTVAEIEAMVEAGIIGEDERFELIGGDVVPLSPKGARHEMVKIELNRHPQAARPRGLSQRGRVRGGRDDDIGPRPVHRSLPVQVGTSPGVSFVWPS
ncbi:hypothetical protein [Mesorhizobium sp. KR9-304]|uniref:hypothetical protein n=1 Tax=Mesorhizobium sp. KR9-304 TaxID=3156614 RepID=UPI0032B3CA6C